MKTLTREGLGSRLFHDWRFGQDGENVADFVLNRAPYRQAGILLAHQNFGCGSSREHAVWALDDFGIRAIIAPSFGSIFATNCVKNGLLPVRLPWQACDALIRETSAQPGTQLTVDLIDGVVRCAAVGDFAFETQADIRNAMLKGMDDISRTLAHDQALADYERRRDNR